METWDALRARRNVRHSKDEAVPAADLERIVEAGWRAPSASNRQYSSPTGARRTRWYTGGAGRS